MSCHSFLHSAQREHAGKAHCRQPWKAQVRDIGHPRLETRASSAYQCDVEILYGGQKCSVIRSFVVKPSLQASQTRQSGFWTVSCSSRGSTASCTRLLSNAPFSHFSHIPHYANCFFFFYSLFLANVCVLSLLSNV